MASESPPSAFFVISKPGTSISSSRTLISAVIQSRTVWTLKKNTHHPSHLRSLEPSGWRRSRGSSWKCSLWSHHPCSWRRPADSATLSPPEVLHVRPSLQRKRCGKNLFMGTMIKTCSDLGRQVLFFFIPTARRRESIMNFRNRTARSKVAGARRVWDKIGKTCPASFELVWNELSAMLKTEQFH